MITRSWIGTLSGKGGSVVAVIVYVAKGRGKVEIDNANEVDRMINESCAKSGTLQAVDL